MADCISFWATVLSPIVGVIAIIIALVTTRSSSRDAEKQVKAVYNLLDVFVASQNPNMMVAKQQYEQQLKQLDEQIKDEQEELETVNPFFGMGGARIDDIEYLMHKKNQKLHITELQEQRRKIEEQLNLILSYLNKAKG